MKGTSLGTAYHQACVVKACYSGRSQLMNKNGGQTSDTFSISGILIDEHQGLVLSHGSLLVPSLKKDPNILNYLENDPSKLVLSLCDVSFDILLLQDNAPKLQPFASKGYYTEMLNCSVSTDREPKSINKYKGKLNKVFRYKKFQHALEQLLPPGSGWKFKESVQNADVPNDANNNSPSMSSGLQNGKEQPIEELLLPWFVLIGLDTWAGAKVRSFPFKSASDCRVGDIVEVVGTPFGDLSPEVFMNSYSRGVLSNLSGEGNALMLTDARCIPGSEGGALYSCDKHGHRNLVGMIVAPLCWKNNEWIGLAIACSLSEILRDMKQTFQLPLSRQDNILTLERTHDKELSTPVSNSVVLIRSGSTWGSGVVIDHHSRLVLTCSHVVRWGYQPTALIKVQKCEKLFVADILYCAPTGVQYDLAVLQTRKELPSLCIPQPLSSSPVVEGQEVRVIGYALFDEDSGLCPSVTSGVISKVTRVANTPVLIQTTCAIHAGASGGVVTDSEGHLMGMAVCNAKDVSSGASFPHINLSIPFVTINPALEHFMKTKDVDVLKTLQIRNKYIQRIWNLGTRESSNGDERIPQSRL